MSEPTPPKKKAFSSLRLNHAFLKYFPMDKEEKKIWKSKEIISLGEAILAHYGIVFLKTLAFELEQLIDTALFLPKNNERHVTSNWITQLFDTQIQGYSLPNAFLGICYEEGIRTQRDFIQAFDYLGICWKLIDYWSVHREERDKYTMDFEKIRKEQFDSWIKLLKIPTPDKEKVKKQISGSQFFFCDDHSLKGLKNDKLTEGIIKLYGALMVKNSNSLNFKNLLEDPILDSILNEIQKITGEKKVKDTIRRYLQSVYSKT